MCGYEVSYTLVLLRSKIEKTYQGWEAWLVWVKVLRLEDGNAVMMEGINHKTE